MMDRSRPVSRALDFASCTRTDSPKLQSKLQLPKTRIPIHRRSAPSPGNKIPEQAEAEHEVKSGPKFPVVRQKAANVVSSRGGTGEAPDDTFKYIQSERQDAEPSQGPWSIDKENNIGKELIGCRVQGPGPLAAPCLPPTCSAYGPGSTITVSGSSQAVGDVTACPVVDEHTVASLEQSLPATLASGFSLGENEAVEDVIKSIQADEGDSDQSPLAAGISQPLAVGREGKSAHPHPRTAAYDRVVERPVASGDTERGSMDCGGGERLSNLAALCSEKKKRLSAERQETGALRHRIAVTEEDCTEAVQDLQDLEGNISLKKIFRDVQKEHLEYLRDRILYEEHAVQSQSVRPGTSTRQQQSPHSLWWTKCRCIFIGAATAVVGHLVATSTIHHFALFRIT